MFYPPPNPKILAENPGSFQATHTDVIFESSAGGATPTMNLVMFNEATEINIANSSFLGQSTLSKTSFSTEDTPSTPGAAQAKVERKAYDVTIGKSLLCALALWLAPIGIVEAAGQVQSDSQLFQQMPGLAKNPRPSLAPTPSPKTKHNPAKSATAEPTVSPTTMPMKKPTNSPTTASPTNGASASPANASAVTYVPGNLTREEVGLLLSEGLRARILATSGKHVEYHNGSLSEDLFHGRPDFGATFADTRPFNVGGWVYASNSEMPLTGEGGVGAITFDKNGNVIEYRMVLVNTTMNCGGGKTPW